MITSERYIHESGLPCVNADGETRIVDVILALGFAYSLRQAKQLIKDGAVKIWKNK